VTETTTRPDTAAAILRAAEQLFASKGIDGVSLREINRAARQANAGALHYHFGDRTGLLRAVIDKHRTDTEARRHALLDLYESSGPGDLRSLVAVLVLPMVAKLGDPDGGREYLRINAELCTRSDFETFVEVMPKRGPNSSIRRWHRLLDDLMPVEERTILHTRFPAMRFAFVELGRRAATRPRRDNNLFASHLVDLVKALLSTEPSSQTRTLLAEVADD
jgi:AcrR family transcriptional regulator